MKSKFIDQLQDLGLTLSDEQWEQFNTYFDVLIEWNDKLNLTSITDKKDVFIKHFYDSLCVLMAMPLSTQSFLDVGSGAGFPSIPLKIMIPELNVTILDALHKRINFLETLLSKLQIDVRLIHGRAEEFTERETYDIVTARAVANLQMLSELCIPFVKVDGFFIAMKGPSYKEEVESSLRAIDKLGAKVFDVKEYYAAEYKRAIVTIKKMAPTNKKYPRRYKKIKTKPL
jgi:16S rRNA (guanine527-N7)-methyltransferase